jgi:hypothetical protein
MGNLQGFVADLLEHRGAAVEVVDAQELAVLAPPHIQKSMGWPEFSRLGFGAEGPPGAIPIGLEGDWVDRLAALLGDDGRWATREVSPDGIPSPGDPQRILDRAFDLPNAVWRFHSMNATHARCLILAFRYVAASDDKREGLTLLGVNTSTGAVITDLVPQMRQMLAQLPDWQAPAPATMLAAGPRWDAATVESRLRPLLDRQLRDEIEPFLRAMRRRLTRDRDRIHAFHDELYRAARRRLVSLAHAEGARAKGDRQRETLRVQAIEREHRAKLDDLRHNYALRVTVEWVQTLELYVPVQRFDVLIRRRKGERLIRLDWHPLVKAVEPPLCEAGCGRSRVRLVCDDKLHLTEPTGQAPCSSCGKPFCRACFPMACPRCGQTSPVPAR